MILAISSTFWCWFANKTFTHLLSCRSLQFSWFHLHNDDQLSQITSFRVFLEKKIWNSWQTEADPPIPKQIPRFLSNSRHCISTLSILSVLRKLFLKSRKWDADALVCIRIKESLFFKFNTPTHSFFLKKMVKSVKGNVVKSCHVSTTLASL